MDLREIQRLHAQFAPDSMTIDLPRQIAALPASAVFDKDGHSSKPTSRVTHYLPALRNGAKPLLIAVIVAMAGVGAARIWHSVHASNVPQKSVVEQVVPASHEAVRPELASEPSVRPIEATPARPVAAAPMLSASDLGGAPSLGLTADQFRNSLSPASPTNAKEASAKTTPSASDEATLAAVSSIRQSHREPGAARVVAMPQPQVVQAESKPAVQQALQAPANTSPASGTAAPAPAQAAERAPSSLAPTARAHNYRHHAVRQRDAQPSESDAVPSESSKKPTTPGRTGSNEVQMF